MKTQNCLLVLLLFFVLFSFVVVLFCFGLKKGIYYTVNFCYNSTLATSDNVSTSNLPRNWVLVRNEECTNF